ncbi:hypothetical protein PoB_002753900 [Plakobranchus ocellatus]|uniref:Uncharacterized protein n=1 Tax=Plakobranchus ocellatus TaxID=259542 RepID=A0AAV4A4A0_9GAST|nr:hypothetical protein PoB_002753900 [Plakobranchus ocellatus]
MLRPVVESSDLAEACQHITDGVSQGITELNTSQQHTRWPTLNQRNVKLIKNLFFPKGDSVAVKKTMDTFSAFLNPFDTEREHLVCISSGQKVSEDVADDLLKVEDVGKKSFKEFVDTRLKDKTTRFHRPLTKTKLKTWIYFQIDPNKISKERCKNKERNVFGQLLVLSQEYQIDMEKVLKYPLSLFLGHCLRQTACLLRPTKQHFYTSLKIHLTVLSLKIFQDNPTKLTSSVEIPYSIVYQVVLIHFGTWQSKLSAVYLRPHLSTL